MNHQPEICANHFTTELLNITQLIKGPVVSLGKVRLRTREKRLEKK
jgi:hypothetical protein